MQAISIIEQRVEEAYKLKDVQLATVEMSKRCQRVIAKLVGLNEKIQALQETAQHMQSVAPLRQEQAHGQSQPR